MTEDLREQFEDIEKENPSVTKLDKKLSLALYHIFEQQDHINQIEVWKKTVDCDMIKAKNTLGLLKWLGGGFASLAGIIGVWFQIKH
jgi:hypothetical protein